MNVLGVRIDKLTASEARQKVRDFLDHEGQHVIFTPNPEMLVDARTNSHFRTVLNQGTLNICDGRGIELVSRGKLERTAGIDFMEDVCAIAAKKQKTVYLLGSGNTEVLEKAKVALTKKFPDLRIVGSHPGIPISLVSIDNSGLKALYQAHDNDDMLGDIIETAPDILFVGFGHIKQEEWIIDNLKSLPSVRLAMGVGGTFDMLSGHVRRAPRLFRFLGLEWLWRLIIQPWRFKRIWKATIQFLYSYYHYD